MTRKSGSYELGARVTARVEQVLPFGILARLPDDTLMYVRGRELTLAGDVAAQDAVAEGQEIEAVVVALPATGRNLEGSVRRACPDPWESFCRTHAVRDSVRGRVKAIAAHGVFVEVVPGVDGYVPLRDLAPWPIDKPEDLLWHDDEVEAMITQLDGAQRRLRLGMRQQLLHMLRVQQITGQLRTEASDLVEPPAESTGPLPEDEGSIPEVDLSPLVRALVIDDHASVRDALVVWLERRGCPADGVGELSAALSALGTHEYGIYFVDLDLNGESGLDFVRAVQDSGANVSTMIISVPEWIADCMEELQRLAVRHVFTKPLDMDEICGVLSLLARGEELPPFGSPESDQARETRSTFHRLAPAMRRGTSLRERLDDAVGELVRLSGAELGLLFHHDPDSRQVRIVSRAGSLPLNEDHVRGLARSPVGDLMQRGGEIFAESIAARERPRFQKLLDVVPFQSCVAVPVPALGRVQHALFLFHGQPEAFSRYRLRDAHATATLLRVALESDSLEARIREASPFLLSGQLAAGFGHEVYNKMSALELEARNLSSALKSRAGQAAGASEARQGCEGLLEDADRLLDATLDLKRTVGVFRSLVGADTYSVMSVNDVVRQPLRLLDPVARRARVLLEANLGSTLPPVLGSSTRLQQVVLNVVLNAIQQITLKAERWPEAARCVRITTGYDAGEAVVWLRCADNGPGIHRQLWSDIFEMGFSTRPDGTGLGLFIARSLMESMGGRIWVEESLVAQGTVFCLTLPVAPV